MSFAGDAYKGEMPTFPSEYSFHLRDTAGKRTFWNNAKQHLFNFINEKNPLAVGLQEMNLTEDPATGGTAAIYAELDKEVYEMVSDKVTTNNAGISIIFNKTVAGDVQKTHIVDNLNQLNGPPTNPKGGRPLLIVYTENGYLFVNMHGAQDAGLGTYENNFNSYMINSNKNFLEEQVNKFLIEGRSTPITPKHIFIMGDFNDRYDAITDFTINGVPVTYQGESPKSCCHNWDSMGITKNKIYREKPIEGQVIPEPNVSDKVQGIAPANPAERKVLIPDNHGITVNDYINKGDKVFASGESGPLQIYKSVSNLDENGVSKASDHELVYMEFGRTLEGGKSRKSRKSKKGKSSKKGKKSRKSRKSKK